MTTPSDDRTEPPTTGDERATLIGFLEFQRQTLEWKCAGLSLDQLRTRAVPPSTMSRMIEEYARHNGHADLLRVRLDG